MQLSDFNTVEDARAYEETKGFLINRDTVNSQLAQKGIYNKIKAIAADDASPFQDIISAFLDSKNYNFIQGNVTGDAQLALLDALIAANLDISQELIEIKQIFIDKANRKTKPFESATQAQFNIAKGFFVSKIINYTAGQELILTLNANLPEQATATTWLIENGFNDENTGRNIRIQNANKYRINMQGKKSGTYQVRVPLVDADFDVEAL